MRRAGGEWRTRCPAHDDDGPSLYVALSLDRRNTLLNCKAGCDAEDIVAALDMNLDDLFHDEDDLVEVDGEFDVDRREPDRPEAARPVGRGPTVVRGDDPSRARPASSSRRSRRCDTRSTADCWTCSRSPTAHRQDLRRRGLGTPTSTGSATAPWSGSR